MKAETVSKTATKIRDITLVWDLDGTLSNNLPANHRTTIRVANFFGLRKPTVEEIRENFDPSGEFREFHRKIGVPEKLKLKRPGENHSIYGIKWMEVYSQELESTPPELTPGVRSLVMHLSKLGVSQYVCSLAQKDHIEKQLGDLQNYFKDFVSVKETKMMALTQLRDSIGKKFLVHVGDTIYDGRSTVSAGVMFGAILHECSYNTEEALRKFVALNHRSAFTINGFENFEEALSNVEFTKN